MPPATFETTPLTTMPEKLAAYCRDTYFLETSEQLESLGVCSESFARRTGLLFLKPDAIVARAVAPTLTWLSENGFRVVSARRIDADRHFVRALWYYQWNIASPQRRQLADLLLAVSGSLLLVVTDAAERLPTTVRLTDRKGPTAPRKRQPGELRHVLGGDTYLLNMVHTADDPADVLRELGIYLPTRERRAVIEEASAGADRSLDAAAIGEALYTQVEARSFDRAVAERSILASVPREVRADPATDRDWAELIQAAWQHDWPLDPWDVLVVGAAVLPMRTPEGTQTLEAAPAAAWLARDVEDPDE